jgi:N utilization substance protein B
MSSARDVRRCALQALYQFDVGGTDAPDLVRESLEGSGGSDRARREGFDLAQAAWASRAEADAAVAALTPDWPTHRQPVVDRNILRLAFHEMASRRTPPKVVINEAVELAREFSTEKSPLFVNGVLDRIFKTMFGGADESAQAVASLALEPGPREPDGSPPEDE